jgi:hypothetical protein
MSDNPRPEGNLEDEFQVLGKNLVAALRAAWDTPERKHVQDELITGLNGLGTTLKHEADNFAGSPAGQQIKNGVEQVGERLRNAETQEKVRLELLNALKAANNELQKVIDRWSARTTGPAEGSEAGSTAEPTTQEKPPE